MNGMNRMRRLTESADGRVNRGMTNKELRTTKEESFRSSQHSFEILRFLVRQSAVPGSNQTVFRGGSSGLRGPASPMFGVSSCSIADCGRP